MPAKINDGLTNRERFNLRHPGRQKASQRKYRQSAKGQEVEMRKHRRRRGIVDATGERRSGPCEICTQHQDGLCSDHDHLTGLTRGWLCTSCNAALGHLGDSVEGLRRALAYLEKNV
jgi:hypothetical protein